MHPLQDTAIAAGEQELLGRAASYCEQISLKELTEERLLGLAKEQGSDFATAVAYQSVCRDPAHAQAIARLERLLSTTEAAPRVDGRASFGLIPNLGYFLDNRPQRAGSLMFDVAKSFGFDTFIVPTPHTGNLQANARLICDTLSHRADDRIVLVSISKGSSDLKIAFDEPSAGEAFRKVVAWINICGLLDGTAVVNLLLDHRDAETEAQILGWFRGRGEDYVHLLIDALHDCGRGPDRPLGGALNVPPDIRQYHIAAFPLERHIEFEHMKFLNQVLLQLGPNDGYALLADLLNKPGVILPFWGSDHYVYQAVDLPRIVAGLLRLICEDCHLASP
ncbi:MAG: hypothetical protein WD063_17635 [Pirellulales bacterium]